MIEVKHTSRKKAVKMARIVWAVTRFLLFLILGFVIIYPLLQILSKTFMPVEQYSDPSVIWIPKSLTLTNIKAAMIGLDFWPTFGRTIVLCVGCALLQVLSCAVVGYGFARFRFKLRTPLFALVIATILVPSQLTFIPMLVQYRYFDFFGVSHLIALFTGQPYTNYTISLTDSYATFFLPSLLGVGIRSGLFIYIYRQFFRNIPRELEEAAKIDGCGPWKTFVRVMMPNARASALTVFLFSIVWHWNESMMGDAFFSTGSKPLSVAVSKLADAWASMYVISSIVESGLYQEQGNNLQAAQGIAYAAIFLFLIPPLVLYIFTQRFFVEGVESTGIKG
ncbi:MAG: carbohydrate ABC transporter permease [Ruminococcus flavefaciens]|nr:carbohydrate ABC transporter permease [Ruminococcus flavefaciens]